VEATAEAAAVVVVVSEMVVISRRYGKAEGGEA